MSHNTVYQETLSRTSNLPEPVTSSISVWLYGEVAGGFKVAGAERQLNGYVEYN